MYYLTVEILAMEWYHSLTTHHSISCNILFHEFVSTYFLESLFKVCSIGFLSNKFLSQPMPLDQKTFSIFKKHNIFTKKWVTKEEMIFLLIENFVNIILMFIFFSKQISKKIVENVTYSILTQI